MKNKILFLFTTVVVLFFSYNLYSAPFDALLKPINMLTPESSTAAEEQKPSNINLDDKSFNELINVLKSPEKRTLLIDKLEEVSKTESPLENHIIIGIRKRANFMERIERRLDNLSDFSLIAFNYYEDLKNYVSEVKTKVNNVYSSLKDFVSLYQLYHGYYGIFTIIFLIIGSVLSYFLEKKISFKIKTYRYNLKKESNVFEKIIYTLNILLLSAIPSIISSIITMMLSVLLFIVFLQFFQINTIVLGIVIKFLFIWGIVRTLLVFFRKIILTNLTLNVFDSVDISYKDIRYLYKWIKIILVIIFIFSELYIIIPFSSDRLLSEIQEIILQIGSIVLIVAIIIFILAVEKRIKDFFLILSQRTQIYYLKKLFKLLANHMYLFLIIYMMFILNSIIFENYKFIVYLLEKSLVIVGLIALHHLLQYYMATFISRFFTYGFSDSLRNLATINKDRINMYATFIKRRKMWELFEKIYYYVVLFILLILLFKILGFNTFGFIKDLLQMPLIFIVFNTLLPLLIIVIITLFLLSIFHYKIIDLETKKEYETANKLASILFLSTKAYVVLAVVLSAITTLSAFGVSIRTLLVSTGGLTLLIGFGAKDILRNFVNAVVFLIEDSFAINDLVEIDGKSGTVESVTALYVKLRDFDGNLHNIPFSNISVVTNKTKTFSYAIVIVGVDYKEDLSKVTNTLKAIGEKMMQDSMIAHFIKEPIDISGVVDLSDYAVRVRCRFKTFPGKQFSVKYELLKQIKEEFEKNNINLPYPKSTVYVDDITKDDK